jgi:uncharacterized protein with beta-barrel porin domain
MQIRGPYLTAPQWAGSDLGDHDLLPGGAKVLASAFNAPDAVVVTVGAAGALAAATSVPVDALSGAIPSGTVLHFGTNKFAVLTAAAAAGATSLAVTAIPTALVDNDTATYAGVQRKSLPSGTIVGRTIAERDAGTAFGPAASTDDEVYIVAFEVPDITQVNDVDLVLHKRVVFENFLPGWTGLASLLKDKVRELYHCTVGFDY